MDIKQARIIKLESEVEMLRHIYSEWCDYWDTLENENIALREVAEAAQFLAILCRCITWEDKDRNVCGMHGGDAGHVQSLRELEKALAKWETLNDN
jgi:hypothetical protein